MGGGGERGWGGRGRRWMGRERKKMDGEGERKKRDGEGRGGEGRRCGERDGEEVWRRKQGCEISEEMNGADGIKKIACYSNWLLPIVTPA